MDQEGGVPPEFDPATANGSAGHYHPMGEVSSEREESFVRLLVKMCQTPEGLGMLNREGLLPEMEHLLSFSLRGGVVAAKFGADPLALEAGPPDVVAEMVPVYMASRGCLEFSSENERTLRSSEPNPPRISLHPPRCIHIHPYFHLPLHLQMHLQTHLLIHLSLHLQGHLQVRFQIHSQSVK